MKRRLSKGLQVNLELEGEFQCQPALWAWSLCCISSGCGVRQLKSY